MPKRKNKKSKIGSGVELFQDYFSEVYGARWPEIYQALCSEKKQVSLASPRDLASFGLSFGQYLDYDYWLDPASCLVASLLPLSYFGDAEQEGPAPEVSIWDMCAAPGGKMLCLAMRMSEGMKLWATEVSAPRFQRLEQQRSLLAGSTQSQVELSRANACLAARQSQRSFDRILLDAPCSSEGHLLGKARLMAEWNPGRSKRNQQTQVALLCAGIDAMNEGAMLLYATCSLSPLENQEAVAKALAKRESVELREVLWQAEDLEAWNLDRCDMGYQVLPDRNAGAGPLYFCLLQRS